ncbi:glycosyl transferase [Nostoc sp. MBR 210]|nr:glycosyl transferase [Nostoc sp. MBR 210]
MSLKFSVITPSFRQGRFIERTIQSVLSQGIEDIDYIVCDGGSDDETVEILKKYHPKIRWVSEADKGQSDAVNKGISMTSGDIIAWINSDDIYYPETFNTVRKIFESQAEIEVIYGDADWIDELDQIIYPYPTENWNYKRLIETCYICQPAVFFRRSLIERFGSLDSSLDYCMDYELWLRYGKYVDFYHLPQKFAGSRMYKTNKTMGKKLQAHYEVVQMLKQKFGKVPDNWMMSYAFVKAEDMTKLNKFDDKEVKKLIWISFMEIVKLKKGVSPKIIIKVLFWYFFPGLSWFRRLRLLEGQQ